MPAVAARLAEVPVHEGGHRAAVRALVDIGDYFVVLARERVEPNSEQFEQNVAHLRSATARAGTDRGIG